MRELILKLNQEHQITFLISSHILDELSRLATHYRFIDKGHMIKEISARDLENACRKGVHVDVSDTGVLSCILDEEGLEYKILTEHTADIYGQPDVTELVMKLAARDCRLKAVYEKDESLESYYIRLLGGEGHA